MRLAVLFAIPALLAAQTPEQLFEQRKLDEARAAFLAQLANDKNDANALYYMGRIAEATDKSSEAVDWFEKAVKRNDTSATYHFWLGSALGDEAQKASKFRQPFLATAQGYYSLASFYRRQSRWSDAFATYEQLMKMKHDEITAHAGWGFTAAQSGTNLERGERELKLFLANLPKDMATVTIAAAHFRLGQIYEKTARKDLAKTEYTEALRINPQHPDAKKALDALK